MQRPAYQAHYSSLLTIHEYLDCLMEIVFLLMVMCRMQASQCSCGLNECPVQSYDYFPAAWVALVEQFRATCLYIVWLNGVRRTCAETATVSRGTSHAATKERARYTTSVDI